MNDSEARPRFRKRWGGRCFPAVLLCIFCSLQTRLDSAQCNDLIWANEASKKPVYNNGIFAKAMTYYVGWQGNPALKANRKTEFEFQVGQALQSALTEWGSTLLLIKSSLDPQLKTYVNNSLFCFGNSCQYNAPPVVRVSCIENAAIVVQVYVAGGSIFPGDGDGAVARSQLEGRTILLDAKDYQFIYDQHLFPILNENNLINLTAVIAHELGHSFGLQHAQNHEKSIMLANLTDTSTPRVPTRRDGEAFAEILRQNVIGTKAGEFESVQCQGLKVTYP